MKKTDLYKREFLKAANQRKQSDALAAQVEGQRGKSKLGDANGASGLLNNLLKKARTQSS